jgi:type IV pilus assembly protein PilV
MKTSRHLKAPAGSALIEALVALVVFSFGVLGLLGLQATSIKNSGDAKYRSDASYAANQIVAQMWVDRSNIDAYAHYASGPVCAFTGSASANTNVAGWLTQIALLLPGASATNTQIQVTTPTASTKQVQVTVCWKTPQDTTAHNFVTTAQINQ